MCVQESSLNTCYNIHEKLLEGVRFNMWLIVVPFLAPFLFAAGVTSIARYREGKGDLLGLKWSWGLLIFFLFLILVASALTGVY